MSGRIFLSLALLAGCFLWAGRGTAQSVTSRGLECAGTPLSFDTVYAPTTTANRARIQAAREVAGAIAAAMDACKAANNDLPGCAVAVPRPEDFISRRSTITADAYRVLANQFCKRAADHSDNERADCTALARAEASAAGFPLNTATAIDTAVDPNVQQSGPGIRLIQQLNALKIDTSKLDPATLEGARDRCAARGICTGDDLKNAAAARALQRKTVMVAVYGNSSVIRPFAQQATADINLAADAVPFARPPPAPSDPTLVSPPELKLALDAAVAPIVAATTDCYNATFVVLPTGELLFNAAALTTPSICVDTSAYSIDDDYQVELDFDSPSQRQFITAKPGEKKCFTPTCLSPHLTGVVRVIVRGYPRGAALRELVSRGTHRLDLTQPTVDLLFAARAVSEAQRRSDDDQRSAKALENLAKRIDSDLETALPALKAALDSASTPAKDTTTPPKDTTVPAKDQNTGANGAGTPAKDLNAATVQTALLAVYDAITKAVESMDVSDAPSLLAQQQARTARPSMLPTTASVADQKTLATKLGLYTTTLRADAKTLLDDAAATVDTQKKQLESVSRVCEISKQLVPLIDEDVLVDHSPDQYVIDYEFSGGYRALPQSDVWQGNSVYVRVHHVPQNGSISVSVNSKTLIEHRPSLVGYTSDKLPGPDKKPDDRTDVAAHRPSIDDVDPDAPSIQGRSTQILLLGKFDGSYRYRVAVCGQTGTTGECAKIVGTEDGSSVSKPETQSSASSHLIARGVLVIHSKHYLGVRAGFGATLMFGDFRDALPLEGSSTSIVRSRTVTPDVAVPVLLTAYPYGRDVLAWPEPFTFGISAGVDLNTLTDHHRTYFGVAFDTFGIGFTFAATVEQRDSIYGPVGSTATKTATAWYPGMFLGITADWDIFDAVFSGLVAPKVPTLSGSKQ